MLINALRAGVASYAHATGYIRHQVAIATVRQQHAVGGVLRPPDRRLYCYTGTRKIAQVQEDRTDGGRGQMQRRRRLEEHLNPRPIRRQLEGVAGSYPRGFRFTALFTILRVFLT